MVDKSNIISIDTGLPVSPHEDGEIKPKKVSFLFHTLAKVAPGVFGEPDLMESKKPDWLVKLGEKKKKKINAVLNTSTPKKPIIPKETVLEDEHPGLLERLGHITGIR